MFSKITYVFALLLALARTYAFGNTAIRQVPVLCYHQIREWTATDSKTARTYIIPIATFFAHMKILQDSGYHPILPDQLIGYLQRGEQLPSKPVMITFDDGTSSQYANAEPILEKAGFKAVFFIMTVTLNRKNFMSTAQVKELSAKGNVVGCHTWDHHNVTGYTAAQWVIQLVKPRAQLEQITGKPVRYFAYPFGAWNSTAIEQLKAHNYTAAFQLSGKQDTSTSLYTIRRIIVDGHWNAKQLIKAIKYSFK